MIPELMHSAYLLYRFTVQAGRAALLTTLILGAALVGFFLGVETAEPVCIEAEVVE